MAWSLRLLEVPAEEADPMMRHTFSALMLIAALGSTAFVPTAQAATRDQRAPAARVYDRAHRDYHTWNAREDRAYRGYLSNQQRPYRAFSRLNGNQQREYWQWRHDGR
jgi:hypothetical protein